MDHNERNILTVTCFGHFMSHFNMLVFPALVIPLTERLGMELGAVLALSFWMYLLFGITALPWGFLGDVIGAKALLIIYYAGAFICGLAAGLFMDTVWIFSASLAGLGLFSGIYHPAGVGLISRGISRMSMAMGYNGIAGNVGLSISPLLTGVINYLLGTRATYFFLAAFNLVGILLMVLLPLQEPPKQRKIVKAEKGGRVAGFVVLCLCVMLGGIAYRGITVILPSYFELRNTALFEALNRIHWLPGSRNVAATALASLVYFLGIMGQYLGGHVAERIELRRGYFGLHLVALPMVFFMAYATDIPLLMLTVGYMIFFMGTQPIENSLVAYLTPDKLRYSAYGVKFIFTFGLGSFAVYVIGWVESLWSLSAVFLALAGVSVSILLSILLLAWVTRGISLNR